MNERVFVALGANLGDPLQHVSAALERLDQMPAGELVGQSSLYRTDPWGDRDQPAFINAVAELRVSVEPLALLRELQAIEAAAGRRRDGRRWGPRVLDLDLLAFGDRQCRDQDLVLPHPRLAERAFVLRPWAEIAAEFRLPGLGTVASLLEACLDQGRVVLVQPSQE